MSDRSLTEAELLAAMHDIRLPADAPGGLLAELLLLLSLGILTALACRALLGVFLKGQARVEVSPDGVRDQSDLSGTHASLAALTALKESHPDKARAIIADVYKGGPLPDPVTLRQLARDMADGHV